MKGEIIYTTLDVIDDLGNKIATNTIKLEAHREITRESLCHHVITQSASGRCRKQNKDSVSRRSSGEQRRHEFGTACCWIIYA